MYVVTGATGNTGRVVASHLLDQKKKVRVIGRSKERLQPLVARGAEGVVADLSDQAALTKAFTGAEARLRHDPAQHAPARIIAASSDAWARSNCRRRWNNRE